MGKEGEVLVFVAEYLGVRWERWSTWRAMFCVGHWAGRDDRVGLCDAHCLCLSRCNKIVGQKCGMHEVKVQIEVDMIDEEIPALGL